MSADPMGIYIIVNNENGRVYVGSSIHIHARLRDHLSELNRGIHFNIHLQRAWKKYGSNNFDCKVLEIVNDRRLMIAREQFWFWIFHSILYNISPKANGTEHSEETCRKISKARKGIKFSEEHRKNLSNAQKGKHISTKTEFQKGMEPWNKGQELSEECKRKISISRRGKNLGNKSRTGMKNSEESNMKRRLAILNKKHKQKEV